MKLEQPATNMDKIIRQFRVQRASGFEQTYPFTTFSCIFGGEQEQPLNDLYFYFRELFLSGIPEEAGKESVSGAPTLRICAAKGESDLIKFAQDSDCTGRGKFQHEVLQEYLMNNDPSCLATEVPVYNEKYLGHIDILRWDGKFLEVVDYKPKAHKEKKAASQVARYRQLLAKRTRIPENLIKASYFDNQNYYSIP